MKRVALLMVISCASNPPAKQPQPVSLVPAPGPVGSPLPQGWVWPVNPQAIARGLTALTVYRPINVTALKALAGTSPCAPVEVAPSIWITPFCGKMPQLSRSAFASKKPLAAALAGPTPSGVDFRALRLDGPIKDQQQAGVCWSFAISTIMDNAIRRAGRNDVMAPLHIIADQEFDLLYDKGAGGPLVLENSWPYDPHKACKLDTQSGDRAYCAQAYGIRSGSWQSDPALVAEHDRADSSGIYRILTFHPLSDTPGNPDEIARVLGTGQAVFAGFDIDVTLWSAIRHQADATIPDWPPSPQSGGHAVTLVGFRQGAAGRQFLVHNSWGTGWGDGGYAWVSERMVHDRLSQAFVVTVGDANGPLPSSTLPTPNPTPIPIPIPANACPQGTIRDALFQTCVAPCSNGAAPIAGFCPIQAPAPAPQPTSACPQGQKADLLTAVCEPACPSGNPRAAGICLF